MKINCYISLSCSSEDALRENISHALSLEKIEADVNFIRIDGNRAEELGLRGSPSIFVDGTEVQPVNISGFS
ncbi:MAG: hypothetical protein AABY42_08515 [Nitrospirota bacterium]|jgi:hypothetical protein